MCLPLAGSEPSAPRPTQSLGLCACSYATSKAHWGNAALCPWPFQDPFMSSKVVTTALPCFHNSPWQPLLLNARPHHGANLSVETAPASILLPTGGTLPFFLWTHWNSRLPCSLRIALSAWHLVYCLLRLTQALENSKAPSPFLS